MVDPDYGLSAVSQSPVFNSEGNLSSPVTPDKRKSPAQSAGLIISLEKSHGREIDPLALPQLWSDWGVENVRQNYAVAKIELYYHPSEEQALAKKKLVAELYDYCQHLGIALLLEMVVYTPAQQSFDQAQFQDAQLTAVQEMRENCHLLALQYPLEPLATATLTTELDGPWVMIDQGYDYSQFKDLLRIGLENGTQGFLAGTSLWTDLLPVAAADGEFDLIKVKKLIQTTVRDRIIELTRITNEFNK